MCEISVIVPVYNVEKYLDECLDSILAQSFKNFEVICVNDGSTDSSSDILNNYAKKDTRIKIITQSNQGLGGARNAGLNKANGNYICFIDSDDYIELDALEKLHSNAISNQSDIALFKFQKVDDFHNVDRKRYAFKIDRIFGDIDYDHFTFTYQDVKKHVLNSAFSACLKLYKKEFLDSIGFAFPAEVHFEDVPAHAMVMLGAQRISFVNDFLYNYRTNPDSITNATANNFDIFKVIDMVEDYLMEHGYYENLENEFILFKIAQIFTYFDIEKSDEFFNRAKAEFEKIEIKDDKLLKERYLKRFNLVLDSDNYDEYVVKLNSDKKNTKSFKDKLVKFLKS